MHHLIACHRIELVKAALYARVSTTDQHSDAQLEELKDYAKRRGLEGVEFVDHGVSGGRASRPALDAMMALARKRDIDLVVATKLDRLGRSVRHLTTLASELEALGVDLVVLDQGIDTTTPTGRLTFHVLAALAEFERGLIRERTTAGLRAARRRGKRLGRPRAYVDVNVLRSGLAEGCTVSELARRLGVSRPTVRLAIARLEKNVPSTASVTT